MRRRSSFINPDKLLGKSLIPPIFCIILCVAFMCSSTFAWFTDSVDTDSSLTAGHFSMEVVITDSNNSWYPLTGNTVHLMPGTYTVKVKNTGTASGYGMVTFAGTTYLIDTFPKTFSIQIEKTEGMDVGFLPCWGNKPTLSAVPDLLA